MPTEALNRGTGGDPRADPGAARERIAPRAAEIDNSAEFPWDAVELLRQQECSRCASRPGVRRHRHGDADVPRAVEEVLGRRQRGLILAVQSLGAPRSSWPAASREGAVPARLGHGEWISAYALTESGAGSDARAMRTRPAGTATGRS